MEVVNCYLIVWSFAKGLPREMNAGVDMSDEFYLDSVVSFIKT